MKTPSIHLNGSSRKHLVKAYKEAYEALLDARHMLQATAPHGRDYYVQGDNALDEAMAEHQARYQKVVDVSTEIEDILNALET